MNIRDHCIHNMILPCLTGVKFPPPPSNPPPILANPNFRLRCVIVMYSSCTEYQGRNDLQIRIMLPVQCDGQMKGRVSDLRSVVRTNHGIEGKGGRQRCGASQNFQGHLFRSLSGKFEILKAYMIPRVIFVGVANKRRA